MNGTLIAPSETERGDQGNLFQEMSASARL